LLYTLKHFSYIYTKLLHYGINIEPIKMNVTFQEINENINWNWKKYLWNWKRI